MCAYMCIYMNCMNSQSVKAFVRLTTGQGAKGTGPGPQDQGPRAPGPRSRKPRPWSPKVRCPLDGTSTLLALELLNSVTCYALHTVDILPYEEG